MSGHNKWSKIKRDKGANDAKRGAVFTKIGNMIAIAAKQGTDPVMNPALALAIEKARAANSTNGKLIAERLTHVNQAISTLMSSDQSTLGYERDGSARSAISGGRSFGAA